MRMNKLVVFAAIGALLVAAIYSSSVSVVYATIACAKSKDGKTEFVNYEPREELCKAGCTLGKKLKVPTYEFLKESITRKYGEDFYNALDKAAKEHFAIKKK